MDKITSYGEKLLLNDIAGTGIEMIEKKKYCNTFTEDTRNFS